MVKTGGERFKVACRNLVHGAIMAGEVANRARTGIAEDLLASRNFATRLHAYVQAG
jgi:hypothetical protein